MNKIVNRTPSTFSGVILATAIAGTMSLTTTSWQGERPFIDNVTTLPGYRVCRTVDTYSASHNALLSARTEMERELRNLVDKILESQVAPDVEFDNIIAANARTLYQHGFPA